MRNARRVCEHVLPLLRLSDDAPLPGACFELAGQCRDLRLETCGHLARFGLASCSFGEPLVRERKGQVIRHASRKIHVVFAEGIGRTRQEEERTEDLSPEWHRHAERRSHTEALEDPAANAIGRYLRVGVVDDVGVAIERGAIVAGEHLGFEQFRIGLDPGDGV